MKTKITFLFLSIPLFISAQYFVVARPAPAFPGVKYGSIAFADIDGDGDDDFYITGENVVLQLLGKLYVNDGLGSFSEGKSASFVGVKNGSIAFSDVDRDGDKDLLIMGDGPNWAIIAALYLNDGSGNFTETTASSLEGVSNGSLGFADVDNDGDEDLVVTGKNNFNALITKLYMNIGNGRFTEASGFWMEPVQYSAVKFSDFDKDGDLDLLISGENISGEPSTKLYSNDGTGKFFENTSLNIESVKSGSISVSDVNSDGNWDVLITGENKLSEVVSKIYLNDGRGSFEEAAGSDLEGVIFGTGTFFDADDDGDQDILLCGKSQSGTNITKLYMNNGHGIFEWNPTTMLEGDFGSKIAISDVDLDGDLDVMISGEKSYYEKITKLYLNDGLGDFAETVVSPFEGVANGSLAFSDVDGDGDKDVLLTGEKLNLRAYSGLFFNDGMGVFSRQLNFPLDSVRESTANFSDIDGDGDADVLISGWNYRDKKITKLYKNDGAGNFSEVLGIPFEPLDGGSVAFSDVDGDGDQDVILTGRNEGFRRVADLFLNNGAGEFALSPNQTFEGVKESSVAMADVDADGDIDVIISGENASFRRISKLYMNDGVGNFSESNNSLIGVHKGFVVFGDVDGDEDEDLIITGQNNSNAPVSLLYHNDGSGNFSLGNDQPFIPVMDGCSAFSDVDQDGDLDVLITGEAGIWERITNLYLNNGEGQFFETPNTPFEGVSESYIAFSDIDDDGDEDVLITGKNLYNDHISVLYTNTGLKSNIFESYEKVNFEFSVYPNPGNSENIYIDFFMTGKTFVDILLFDQFGSLLDFYKSLSFAGENILSLNVSDLPRGLYFLQLKDEFRKGVKKIVIH